MCKPSDIPMLFFTPPEFPSGICADGGQRRQSQAIAAGM